MAAGLKQELATNPRPRMAVRIARATRPRLATRTLVQVQAVGVNVLYRSRFGIAFRNDFLMVALKSDGNLHPLVYHVVDGITSETALDGGWSDFGACSKACDGGNQSRNCSNPAPANGGKNCVGDSAKTCNTQSCRGKTGVWGQ